MTRLKGHYNNNVWEKRTEPPSDWNKPLPDYLQSQYERTYLNIKSKELRGEQIPDIIQNTNNCVIL